MKRFRSKTKAVSTLEYVGMVVLLLGVMLAMQTYINRGLAGRWKATGDTFEMRQFDPKSTLECEWYESPDLNAWYNAECYDGYMKSNAGSNSQSACRSLCESSGSTNNVAPCRTDNPITCGSHYVGFVWQVTSCSNSADWYGNSTTAACQECCSLQCEDRCEDNPALELNAVQHCMTNCG